MLVIYDLFFKLCQTTISKFFFGYEWLLLPCSLNYLLINDFPALLETVASGLEPSVFGSLVQRSTNKATYYTTKFFKISKISFSKIIEKLLGNYLKILIFNKYQIKR